jgi:hypothetical protein
MGFGGIIRVGSWRGDPEAAIYVVAEPDPTKAIDIIAAKSVHPHMNNPPKTLFKNCPPLRRSGEELVQKLLEGIFSRRLAATVVSK